MDVESINDVLNELDSGSATSTLEQIKKEMENQVSMNVLSTLWVESGIVNLFLELIRKAISDCKEAIELDPNNLIAYFVLGVCYLWKDDEENAIRHWMEGVKKPGTILTHIVLSSLIENASLRELVRNLKFDVKALFDFHDYFDQNAVDSSYGMNIAYKYFEQKKYSKAITYFTILLNSTPANYEALKYRGMAYCLKKQYKEAIKDLTSAISIKETDDLIKYRATAYAKSGDIFLAIQDLSYVLQNSPVDYDTLVTRGNLHMRRGCFTLALTDFRQIPSPLYNPIAWMNYAEALYALGDLQHSKEMMQHVDETESRRAFLEYLIAKDMGDLVHASNSILQLAATTPTLPILKATGEQMFECGRFHNASAFFEMAQHKAPNDVDLLRLFAISKFCEHSFAESLEICNKITIDSSKFLLEIDMCKKEDDEKFNSPLLVYAQNEKPFDISEKAIKTSEWILTVITHLNDKLETITPTALLSKIKLSEIDSQKLESPKQEKDKEKFKQFVNLADEIGKRVLVLAREVYPSQRFMRAIGMCTLYLANIIKTYRVNQATISWKDPLDIILAILSLADPRKIVQWCDGSIGSVSCTTNYFISLGERISPRFSDFYNICITKLREEKKNSNSITINGRQNLLNQGPQTSMNSLEDIYSFEQSDFATSGSLPGFDRIPKPSIILRKCTNGFDLIVSPRSNPDSAWQSAVRFDEQWKHIIIDEDPVKSLSAMVLLIWCCNQFTHHSPVIGHIFIHAVSIAMTGFDVNTFGSAEKEVFMEQLINPDHTVLFSLIQKHFAEEKVQTQIPDDMISYIDQDTTVADILIALSLVIPQTQ